MDTNISVTDLSNAGDECPSDWWPIPPSAAEIHSPIFQVQPAEKDERLLSIRNS